MTDADKIAEGLQDALSVAAGDQPAARLHVSGWTYVPETLVHDLVVRAKKLVSILDDREKNHGALIGPETLNARNELALELQRWSK